MKRLFLLLAILASAAVHAEGTTAHVTIVYPTKNIDESPLLITEIDKVVIRWFRGTALIGTANIIAPATTIDVPNLVCGDFKFTAVVIKKDGKASDESTGVPNPYSTGVNCQNPKQATLTVS